MNINPHWTALLKPARATNFFNQKVKFQADVSAFNFKDAYWLAELCRLSYKKNNPKAQQQKQKILKRIGAKERLFMDKKGVQCSLIEVLHLAEPCLILVFRGTDEFRDWLTNIETYQTHSRYGEGRVHKGFQRALDYVWSFLVDHLKAFNGPLFYTGHSLGAALATLALVRYPANALYTFGSPRVGDQAFVDSLKEQRVYRVVNNKDIVTMVPPSVQQIQYRHVGDLYYFLSNGRMFINPIKSNVKQEKNLLQNSIKIIGNKKYWFDPPTCLADHSPVNYVVQLIQFID